LFRLCTHLGVERLGFGHSMAAGFAAHRQITDDALPITHGGGLRLNPIVIAVLAPVLDHAAPGAASGNRVPHVPKGFGRHVWVTNHIVGLPHQLVTFITTHRNEVLIAIGDPTFQVSH
jgi:hypothetical protein